MICVHIKKSIFRKLSKIYDINIDSSGTFPKIGIAGIEPTLLIRINSIESPNPLDHIPTYTEDIELTKIAFER